MKLLAVVSTLDLKYRLGCTPAWWQLLKALSEGGIEIVAVPYLGRDLETLWWRTHPNPLRFAGELYYTLNRQFVGRKRKGANEWRERIEIGLTRAVTLPVWKRHLNRLVAKERDLDAVVFFNIPINQIKGVADDLRRTHDVKTVFYDGDMPTILPEFVSDRGFMFNYYREADLTEYDLFLVNSEGVIENLEANGARNVRPLHYAADPTLFEPIETESMWDVAFFGYGAQSREKWMRKMIAEPSMNSSLKFAVGGGSFGIDMGNANLVGDVPMSGFTKFCCSSKVNLNITRESHTGTYASSTARPFELAAMGCCIVSCPYNGIEKWFEPKKEIIILSETDSVVEVYDALLGDPERCMDIGNNARERVLKDHTYKSRARDFVKALQETKSYNRRG